MAKISGQNGKVILSGTASGITGATGTTTITITSAGHPFDVGDTVWIAGVVGMTDLNGEHVVTAAGATFAVVIAATAQTYSSGGTATPVVTIMSWTLDIANEVIQTTDSSVSDWHTFIDAEFSGGSGTFEAFFVAGASDVALGSSVYLQLRLDDDNYYVTTAFVTGNSSTTDVPGAEAVKKTYTFTNTSTITLTQL